MCDPGIETFLFRYGIIGDMNSVMYSLDSISFHSVTCEHFPYIIRIGDNSIQTIQVTNNKAICEIRNTVIMPYPGNPATEKLFSDNTHNCRADGLGMYYVESVLCCIMC